MTEPLLKVRGVAKSFGAIKALGPVDLDLAAGERLGIIGPNGSGKTTLINCITGFFRPDRGAILQIPRPFVGMTVFENLLVPMDYCTVDAKDERQRAEEVLRSVGLSRRRDALAESLTQLEQRKLELARALAASPQVLIADEAMAGLSGTEIDDILDLLFNLNASGVAIIMIEHIMHAVMRFSQRMICLETGMVIAEGTPATITRNPHVQKAYFGEQAAR
jgi:branched-chain amino acid transport system ATP-binding protein